MELRPSIVQGATTDVVDLPSEAVERTARLPLLRRLFKWAVLLVLLIVCVDGIASLLVRRDRVRKRLNARLEAAFGRPVEVQYYSFSLWGGPTLEADGISVGEDPRFGHEYFLRADSLSVRLRWLSLLRGRFELGVLSLSVPIVNIVTDASGNWNLAEWLGHPAAPAANVVGPMRIPFVPKFRQINVDGGRINFKRGDEKLPFAFIGVTGSIYSDGPQRWRLDLEAAPWRAAQLSQQAGTIHLAGSVGGTSSALRPANVQLTWTDASASDFLRLLTGDDSGVRGSVAIGLNAQTAPNGWTIQAQALLGELHRWDLTLRPDAPALNVTAKMLLDLPASTLQITQASVQAPHSNVQASGKISWQAPPVVSKQPAASPVDFEIRSASVDFSDLLAWLRAFRQDIPPGLTIKGFARVQGSISGWPARLTNMTAQTYGAELSGGGLVTPLHLGEADVTDDHGSFHLMPATVSIGATNSPPAGIFHVDFNTPTGRLWSKNPNTGLHLAGNAASASDVIAVAKAFGWDVARGWQLAGPLHCDLRWPQTERPWAARPVGTVMIGGTGDDAASLHAPFLNLPVSGLSLQIDLQQGGRHVTVASADAFGAHWTGTFDRSDAAPMWQFALSADQLSTPDFDRWLNPRWRESFLDRMLPFLNSAPATAVPDNLRGTGRLTVANLFALPFALRNLAADATIDGRKVTLDRVSADLSGGQISGSFQANLSPTPAYQARATFSAIDIASLAGDSERSQTFFAGTASGNVDFSMKGTSRADFANSLSCKGVVNVHDGAWHGVRLSESLQSVKLTPGDTAFDEASSQFTCANAALSFSNILVAAPSAQIAGTGTSDFAGNLDLDLHLAKGAPGPEPPSAPSAAVHVTGTPSAPHFSRVITGRRR
jgi:uncharacterized protein involved in outer membrane biogenesis